jgi:DNA-binding MarR family transcriptional regulator
VIEILERFGRFKRAMNLLMVKDIKPLGLGPKQASMLRYLSNNPESSHADLARHTVTDPAATGRVVAGMIARGLVRQMEHPSDKRRWVLSLTPRGRTLARRITVHVDEMAKHIAAPLNSKERKILIELLDRIEDSLTQKGYLQ